MAFVVGEVAIGGLKLAFCIFGSGIRFVLHGGKCGGGE
jgi:hypothetical protein